MDSDECNFLDLLPPEIIGNIISRITNIFDVLHLRQVSRTFKQYTSYIQHITANRLTTVPASLLSPFINLETVDHKIVVILDELKLPDTLQCIHFLIYDIESLNILVRGLKSGYYKISIVLYDKNVGVLIFDKKFLIIPLNNSHKEEITKILNVYLTPMSIPNTGQIWTRFILLKNPMREFLRSADFGLVDPRSPPSETNPPLSDYIKLIADGATLNLLQLIFQVYMIHNQTDIYFGIPRNSGHLTSKYIIEFGQVIRSNDLIGSVTVKEIAEYDFPNLVTYDNIDYVRDLLNNAKTIYRDLIYQSRNMSGVTYYCTDGTLKRLS